MYKFSMDAKTLVLFCFNLLFFVSGSLAKWVEGYIDTTKSKMNWKFLTRFCFLSEKGAFTYTFFYPTTHDTLDMLFYNDKVWHKIYPSDKSCIEKLAVLDVLQNQIIYLDNSSMYLSPQSKCYKVFMPSHDGKSNLYWNCSGRRTFRTQRETWWFIAVSRCLQASHGLKLKYSIHLTNGEPDEKLYYEFSADEFYILPTDITFFLIHLIILGCTVAFSVMLNKRQLLHTTFKMYIVAVALWTFHLFLLTIAYGKYSNTGRSIRGTKVTARIVSSASDIIFLLLILLMASGFSITRGKLKSCENIIFTVFTCVYIVAYSVLLIWEETMFDEGLVLYIYESDAGYCLVGLRIIAWFLFSYFSFDTYLHFESKRKFYIPFYLFYTVWFFLTPLMILISNLALPLWMREKTVNGIELFIGLIGHLFFLVLTSPSAANKNFPYHIRTSQIGFMDGTEVSSINEYAVGQGPDFSALFVVSQTYTKRQEPQVIPDSPQARYETPMLGGNQSGDCLLSQNNMHSSYPYREHHRRSNIPRYEAMFQVQNRLAQS